jgi:outer membrane receptor for ferrienterochelin and colicin
MWGGQTGKITGRVIDASTGEILIGSNIVLEGTTIGAASDVDGDYVIINVPPGLYTITTSMLSYQDMRITNVKVIVDQTTRIDFELNPSAIELGEVVTVEAERQLIQKDLTATASSVGADEIETMPVESLQDILKLQAGVVVDKNGDTHIRGGRASEINYLVDGVSVRDPFSGKATLNVDQGVVQELKVISGTFNAEYGQVMSGIVEIVTKNPGNKFQFSATAYAGDYVSSAKDPYYNIDEVNPSNIYNLQFYLTGPFPLLKNKLSYFLSLRHFNNDGWIYGERRYNPGDSSSFDARTVYIEQSGDNKAIPMNYNRDYYGNLKVVFKMTPTIKLNYGLLGSRFERRFYNHLYQLNPDGDNANREYALTNMLEWNHTLSAQTFYTLKLSYNYFDSKSYLYENPDDSRYVNPELLLTREDAYSFFTGGTNMLHAYRNTNVAIGKFDITSQITKIHQVKGGIEYKYNKIEENNFEANYRGTPGGGIFSTIAFFNKGKFNHDAIEAAAYFQDKIELNHMTLNIGLRYDYFDSRGKVPVDLRAPDSVFTSAEVQHQWSPRIGLAFPISERGVVHASYGHFFQIPPYELLFENPNFAVAPGGLSTLMGNANLKPQSTIIYELGFQQELFEQLGLDITGFYKDVRNLIGTKIYESYVLGDRYARYENLDYGNIKGITLSINKKPTPADHVTISFDYTFQVAEGNASDPNHEFNNQQSFPPKKSNIQVVPLDWDQRHTINLALSYHNLRIFSAGLIWQLQSGLPYTPTYQNLQIVFENSGRKPFISNVDFRIARQFNLLRTRLNLFLKIYNLFDRRNEIDVYQDTGRAGYSLVSHYTGERNAQVNTLDEWIQRPDFYSEPRKILLGFEIGL